MKGDYVKINRSLLEWGWYQDKNTCRLFIHMLLKANWKDGFFLGIEIKRGSFVSSLAKLSEVLFGKLNAAFSVRLKRVFQST